MAEQRVEMSEMSDDEWVRCKINNRPATILAHADVYMATRACVYKQNHMTLSHGYRHMTVIALFWSPCWMRSPGRSGIRI